MVFTWWAGAYGGGAQRDGNHDRKFVHRMLSGKRNVEGCISA
jgi:hypothetical protein